MSVPTDLVSFLTVAGLAMLASMVSDSLWFLLGRWRADWIRQTRFYRRVGGRIERFADLLGPWQILAARFVYGSRIPTMIFWGSRRRLPYWQFLVIDAVACAGWAVALCTVGFAARDLGRAALAALAGQPLRAVLAAVALLAVLALGLLIARRRVAASAA